jgi:hypothetical protein
MNLADAALGPIAEIERSQRAEIEKYQWLESEKLGRDIGWECAHREWMAQHFPAWKQYRWQQAIAEATDRPPRSN